MQLGVPSRLDDHVQGICNRQSSDGMPIVKDGVRSLRESDKTNVVNANRHRQLPATLIDTLRPITFGTIVVTGSFLRHFSYAQDWRGNCISDRQ